jgi:dienelactone hydrolase
VWNHGSEQDPQSGADFDALAQIFVPAGYVLFAPVRRGQGQSKGQSLVDQMAQAQQSGGAAAAQKLFVQQMEGPQLADQLAGLAYLKTQAFVNQDQLAVAGCGSGGVQALLAAAQGAGYKAAVAESPGSDMWDGDTALQQSLTQAAQNSNVPVFLVQPDQDVSAGPSYTLGQEFLKLGKAYSVEIVPPYGTQAEQGQCFGGASGYHWWADDVLAFIHEAFTPSASIADPGVAQKGGAGIVKKQIALQSDGLTLEAFVYRPQGPGPFPGLIWNHGSEQDPVGGGEFDNIAELFVPHGYVLVTPARRGHSDSQGTYISDAVKAEGQAHGKDAAAQLMVKLMSTEQLDDQLAGLNYLKTLPYVDTTRLADIGCSYGGIETMFGAEAGDGFKAAIAISPGAESWNGNKYLDARLLQAVDNIQIPVFVIHPAKDASLNPGFNLGPEFQKLGKPYGLKIFPPFGPEQAQGHCFPGGGTQIWGPDVLTFLSSELH